MSGKVGQIEQQRVTSNKPTSGITSGKSGVSNDGARIRQLSNCALSEECCNRYKNA